MARHVGWVEQSETHQRPRWVSQGLNPSYVTCHSPLLQPRPQPFHRFTDVSRSARIAEADEVSPMHRIEIGAGRRSDARLLQHAAGEIEAVAAKTRHIGVEIEGPV